MSHAAHSHDAAAGHAGHHDPKVPRGALLAAAALLSLVLVSVAGVRLSGVEIRDQRLRPRIGDALLILVVAEGVRAPGL